MKLLLADALVSLPPLEYVSCNMNMLKVEKSESTKMPFFFDCDRQTPKAGVSTVQLMLTIAELSSKKGKQSPRMQEALVSLTQHSRRHQGVQKYMAKMYILPLSCHNCDCDSQLFSYFNTYIYHSDYIGIDSKG